MSRTVCDDAMVHEVAALVGRAGGWTGRVTIRVAKRVARDPDPWVAEARKLGAEGVGRLRARCVLRVGAVTHVVRWDGLAGDA